MKLRNSLLAAALVAVVSTSAAAQSTEGVVTISGSLVPSPCTVTLGGGGNVDFGQINYTSLNQNTHFLPGTKTVNVAFSCSGPTAFAVRVTDNKFGSTNTAQNGQFQWYGLGKSADNRNIGFFSIAPIDPIADGSPSTLIKSVDATTWVDGAGGMLERANDAAANKYYAFGTDVGGVIPATTGSFNFTMITRLYSRNDMQLTQDASIDGSATFELIYL